MSGQDSARQSPGSGTAENIIETSGLTKRYGRTRALDGLDLRVNAGEVHGFLGPNGAGKSTSIRILLGLARASSGTAQVFGLNAYTDAVSIHRRIAYVPGDVNLWPNLTGGEAIDLLGRLRGSAASASQTARRRAELIEAFEFDPTKKGRSYSKGNRQKVALIAALQTPAELYLLDEPTSGLDPVMEAVFGQQIAALRGDGATVLLSSHILSEVEELCDRVSIIRAGKLVETGTLAELRHLTRTEVSFLRGDLTDEQLTSIPNTHDLLTDAGGTVRFTVDSTQISQALPALGELRVTGLTISPPSLEELFLRHYGEQP